MRDRIGFWVRRWLSGAPTGRGKGPSSRRPGSARPELECLEERALLSVNYVQTNLVSDLDGMAAHKDTNLSNPWGLSYSPAGPFWVSDNGPGVSTLYDSQGVAQPPATPLIVNIPSASGPSTTGLPTGTVYNSLGSGFNVTSNNKTGSSIFLFDTEDGLIVGWSPSVDQHNAFIGVNNHAAGASYKGLTMGVDQAGQTLLYAANLGQATIDVYDSTFTKVTNLAGTFHDAQIPSGYAPFDIENLAGKLYVTYAKVDPATGDDIKGAGLGFVDVYTTDGVLVKHLISGGALNDPWGLAIAPNNFGPLSNDLLVGNFGDGTINAFNPTTGASLGALTTSTGQPFQIDGLWALKFGNGGTAGPTNTLFFTAGINDESHGVFGSLQTTASMSSGASILTNLPSATVQSFSTVPANGDVNPYGVAFVPSGVPTGGKLAAGDLLVSNFNNSTNTQGTGSTIQLITPAGQTSTFFQGPAGLGLTTALSVLKSGFVIVGNAPADGNGSVKQGSLLVLDKNGQVVFELSDSALLQGPWDMTVSEKGSDVQVYVSNVLSGTVTRINVSIPAEGAPTIESETQIASGYAHRTDPNALVVGPTGLAYDAKSDTLFVASTGDNAIFAIHHASALRSDKGTGKVVVQNESHLHGPLGLVLAPNGDLIVSNGDAVSPGGTANDLVEYDRKGHFVSDFQVDPGNAGAAFGIALSTANGEIRFAAVDDDTNAVNVYTLGVKAPPKVKHGTVHLHHGRHG
jgi:uncharacterized protein (TIGR03118 family)